MSIKTMSIALLLTSLVLGGSPAHANGDIDMCAELLKTVDKEFPKNRPFQLIPNLVSKPGYFRYRLWKSLPGAPGSTDKETVLSPGLRNRSLYVTTEHQAEHSCSDKKGALYLVAKAGKYGRHVRCGLIITSPPPTTDVTRTTYRVRSGNVEITLDRPCATEQECLEGVTLSLNVKRRGKLIQNIVFAGTYFSGSIRALGDVLDNEEQDFLVTLYRPEGGKRLVFSLTPSGKVRELARCVADFGN